MDLMAEKVDRKQLVDLLKHMLMLDQERRIKPDEALNHPFQTMSHLLDYVHCTTYDHAVFRWSAAATTTCSFFWPLITRLSCVNQTRKTTHLVALYP